MKICLRRVNNVSSCNEFNLIICADSCIGRRLRRSLPRCICGDGIKINIIVTGCDGVLPAPALPCNDLIAISSPIRVIRRNPCCRERQELCCDDFDRDNFRFGADEFSSDCKFNDDFRFNDDSNFNDDCNVIDNFVPETLVPERFVPQEFAIIVRSFCPDISEFLCKFPQMFITDCDNTVRLIIIFDRRGSVFDDCCCDRGFRGGCGCGFGGGFGCGCGFGCGFGGGFGCGCGCLFGLTALALLFCC